MVSWSRSLVFRRFSAFLYVGQANKDYFRYHGVPEERLFFAPHAVDNERFMRQEESARRDAIEWKKSLGIPEHHKVILFAGKFEPKKRPGDLIAAYLRSFLLGPPKPGDGGSPSRSSLSPLPSPPSARWTLLMVGNGPLEQQLKAQISAFQHSSASAPGKISAFQRFSVSAFEKVSAVPHVVFAPFQNQTQMPRTYAAADLFVLPSFGPGETWGLAVNEAMCMGLPIIVSDHVGCAQDLVHPGRNGLVFPAGNIDALTDALCEACSDPERLQRWGQESRAIIQNYSYEQTTKGLLAALNFVQRPQDKTLKS